MESTLKPLLSIICLTFNHENYIKKCLDGFVNQNTNFDFEIIIHDDASSDKTVEIIRSYEIKYPRLFKNIYQNENQYKNDNINIWIDIVFPYSKGKYIALCDGDDYWIDQNKLQKQVDFLENNNDFNICFHEVSVLKNNYFCDNFVDKTKKNVTTIYDLAVWGNYIHTSSVVFKKNAIVISPEDKKYMCDYILYNLILKDKKIKKINDIMSVYRYGDGVWANSSNKSKQKFIIDNIYITKRNTNDDTINEIMQLRLNSIALYSLPKYLTKLENSIDRSIEVEINEKIPISILIKIIRKKIISFLKKFKFKK